MPSVLRQIKAGKMKSLAMRGTVTRMDGIGAEISPMAQAKFMEFHNAEYKRFGDLIARKNIKLDQ